MDNLMQDFPLRVTSIIDHAAKYHPERKIISKDTKDKITDTNNKNIKTYDTYYQLNISFITIKPTISFSTIKHYLQ